MTIKPEDGVIVCARNEDDVSHLEACGLFVEKFMKKVDAR